MLTLFYTEDTGAVALDPDLYLFIKSTFKTGHDILSRNGTGKFQFRKINGYLRVGSVRIEHSYILSVASSLGGSLYRRPEDDLVISVLYP